MKEIIPLQRRKIGPDEVNCVNARELHAFLGVGKDFSNWIKDRIEQYGFVEGVDYVIFSRPPILASGNRGAAVEYFLSMDMAKELSMVERTEKGKEARQYFLERERVAISQAHSFQF
jgi:anti-repressor protein